MEIHSRNRILMKALILLFSTALLSACTSNPSGGSENQHIMWPWENRTGEFEQKLAAFGIGSRSYGNFLRKFRVLGPAFGDGSHRGPQYGRQHF